MNLYLTSDITDNAANGTSHRVYSKEEHLVIDKYKDKYLAANSSTDRKNIVQLEMFPELFNYWKSNGIVYDKETTKMKSIVCVYPYLSFPISTKDFYRNSFNGYAIHGG
jgi:hypothetical protein